jgi:hypothetical protein
LTNSELGEKSITGRLSIISSRLNNLIDEKKDNPDQVSKPHQVLIGANYQAVSQFACIWAVHKNSKVRQAALQVIVDLCKYNILDPNGQSFRSQIISFVLQLKQSIRDPLIKKINIVTKTTFIDAEELGLNLAIK